jgi:hypothetical protein
MEGEKLTGLPRRLSMDRKGVHSIGKFPSQRRINHAMAFDPALPLEGSRHDIEPKMRSAARPVAGVAFMQV